MGNENKSFTEILGRCFGWIILGISVLAFSGYVTQYLWNGLISPTFNLRLLTYWQALGLDVFVTYIASSPKSKDSDESAMEPIIRSIIGTFLMWGLGALVMIFI